MVRRNYSRIFERSGFDCHVEWRYVRLAKSSSGSATQGSLGNGKRSWGRISTDCLSQSPQRSCLIVPCRSVSSLFLSPIPTKIKQCFIFVEIGKIGSPEHGIICIWDVSESNLYCMKHPHGVFFYVSSLVCLWVIQMLCGWVERVIICIYSQNTKAFKILREVCPETYQHFEAIRS